MDSFCLFVKNRDLENIIKALNDESFNINSHDPSGWAPLHYLFDYDLKDEKCIQIFNLILKRPNFDINIRTMVTKDTILHLQCSRGVIEKILNTGGFSFKTLNGIGTSPFCQQFGYFVEFYQNTISVEESVNTLKLFLQKGADFCESTQNPAICINLMLLKLDVTSNPLLLDFFKFLIRHPRYDINHQDCDGDTLLHLEVNPIKTMEILKVEGVDINRKNLILMTPVLNLIDSIISPLLFAFPEFVKESHRGILECIKCLIENGASVKDYNLKGYAFVHYIVESQIISDENMFNYLVNHPRININQKTINGANLFDLVDDSDVSKLLQLPFEPIYLLSALKTHNASINNEIYKKWNEKSDNFVKLVIRKFCEISKCINFHLDLCWRRLCIYYNLWKYLKTRNVTKGPLKDFYGAVDLTDAIISLKTYDELLVFVDDYAEYGNRNDFEYLHAHWVWVNYGDCKALKKIVKYILPGRGDDGDHRLSIAFYLINCDYDLNNLHFTETDHPLVYKTMLHMLKYCTFNENCLNDLIEYGQNHGNINYRGQNKGEIINGLLEYREKFSRSPKSLLEMSRNVLRVHLCRKLGIKYPGQLAVALNQLNVERNLQEIILLERPVREWIVI